MQANYRLDAFHFHAVNILLYAILCALSFPAFRTILQSKGKKDDLPFLASILFTVHPIHTEMTASIVGRADILGAVLFLTAFISYRRSIKSNSLINLFLVFLAVCCATLCKETAITVLVRSTRLSRKFLITLILGRL